MSYNHWWFIEVNLGNRITEFQWRFKLRNRSILSPVIKMNTNTKKCCFVMSNFNRFTFLSTSFQVLLDPNSKVHRGVSPQCLPIRAKRIFTTHFCVRVTTVCLFENIQNYRPKITPSQYIWTLRRTESVRLRSEGDVGEGRGIFVHKWYL